MIRVLCPGAALDVTHLVDAVRPGGITRPHEVIRLAGGKGVNLARAAAALGGAVEVIAPLGGHIGRLVGELAASDGIAVIAVEVGGETRMCVSVIPDEGAPTEFYEPSASLTAVEAAALIHAVPTSGTSWLAVCGRVPDALGLDPLGERLLAARAGGASIALDTSGAALTGLLERATPDLVKVNRAEAAEALGHDGTAAELARELRSGTGGIAVVTDGAVGAAAASADGAWIARPDPEPGRFAIGSGDGFLAGLLLALDADRPLAEALARASAVGSANTRRPAAGRLDPADVDAALARIRVESV